MEKKAIIVENLGKMYRINHQGRGYQTLRDKILSIPSIIKGNSVKREDFWALKDVSFEIEAGDRVGIIGRNGAGKSTLLKLLSRITKPTHGRAVIRGRVASLLEVGTGFHPELTGRENIFMNGALLGMTRTEIKGKFDEIVDFAEVENFIDTPVKRYSSGMYVRLAFAVAAHLEPELLIIDEVLAVGDVQFQKKCIGKMEDVSKREGRTILFVSHNMDAISLLCRKAILLEKGLLQCYGNVQEIVSKYNSPILNKTLSVNDPTNRGGVGGIRVKDVSIKDLNGNVVNGLDPNTPFCIIIEAEVDEEYQQGKKITVAIGIDAIDGPRIYTCISCWEDQYVETNGHKLKAMCFLKGMPLISGEYLISVAIIDGSITLDMVEHCHGFYITKDMYKYINLRTKSHGYLSLPFSFSAE